MLKHLTAHTDGNEIFVNSATFGALPDEEQLFHIAKNVCHIAFRHVQRGMDKEDKKLWVVASSAVVNQLLAQDGHTIPDGMINIKNAHKYTVEEVYNRLIVKNINPNNFNTEDHGKWYPKMKKAKDFLDKFLKGSGDKKEKQRPDSLHPEKQAPDEGEQDMDERKFQKTEKREQWQDNLEDMAKDMECMGGTKAGTEAGNKLMRFGTIGQAEKIVNWKRLLRAALEDDDEVWGHKLSIKQNNWAARIEDRELDEKILTEVVVDTSGSVDDDLLHSFLAQLKTIIRDSELKVGCFDQDFHGFVDIKSGKDIDNFEIKGRGGTNFDIAVNAFSKKADNRIVFTDGCASMPKKEVPAIWVVYGSEEIHPAGGKVIMASESQILGTPNIALEPNAGRTS
jgi:predicted metal-dependent peptidase